MKRHCLSILYLFCLTLALVSCGSPGSDQASANESALIRLLDDPAFLFQVKESYRLNQYREDVPLIINDAYPDEGLLVAEMPTGCLKEVHTDSLPRLPQLEAEGEILEFVFSESELVTRESGWAFQTANTEYKNYEISDGEAASHTFNLAFGIKPVIVIFREIYEDVEISLSNNGTDILTVNSFDSPRLKIPAELLYPGPNTISFKVTYTGPKSPDRVRIDGFHVGETDQVLIKSSNQQSNYYLSYYHLDKQRFKFIFDVVRGNHLHSNSYLDSKPYFKASYHDIEDQYGVFRRSIPLFQDHPYSYSIRLPQKPSVLDFAYGYNYGLMPGTSALTVKVVSVAEPDKKIISTIPMMNKGRIIWYEEILNLEKFAGEDVVVSFSLETPVADEDVDFNMVLGEPIIRPRKRQEGDYRKNVILVSLDTMRGDRLSALGRERKTTPYLDDLVSKSLTYSNFYSLTSWTLPSHQTMLTGFHDIYMTYLSGTPDQRMPMVSTVPTLATYFKGSGYRTYGLVDAGYVSAIYGFERDFDEFSEFKQSFGYDIRVDGELRRKKHVHWQRAIDWVRHQSDSHPFFMFLHTYSPHTPYTTLGYEHLWYNQETDSRFQPDLKLEIKGKPGKPLIEHVNRLYDRNMRRTDDELNAFFAVLEEQGLLENSIIVITADHGEILGEHVNRLGRHGDVWEPVIRIPLIIYDGGQVAAELRETRASLLNLTPTILSMAGLDIPDYLSGRSLLDASSDSETIFVKHHNNSFQNYGLIKGEHKLQMREEGKFLYHLPDDPGENNPLPLNEPDRLVLVEEMENEMLLRFADQIPGWNIFVKGQSARMRIRFANIADSEIYSAKAFKRELYDLDAFINYSQHVSTARKAVYSIEQREPGSISPVVEVWDDASQSWKSFTGEVSLFAGDSIPKLPNEVQLPQSGKGPSIEALVAAAARAEVVIWYSFKPFSSTGSANSAELSEEDTERLRNLGYLQ